eukprot:gene22711-biopygen10277
MILKWKDVLRGRPIVSYYDAARKGRLRSISKILDRLLRSAGGTPDVWSVPDAVSRISRGPGARDLEFPCGHTRPLVGASDVVGMFTNIDRSECLHALRVFLDEK